jgi:uracil-DNA glycosylase
MTTLTWEDLSFWQSGEHQVIEEKLDDMDKMGMLYSPRRELIYSALDRTPRDKVKAIMVGQDPYPNYGMATGLAFSIPKGVTTFPPTLANILTEYNHDLHYPPPNHGDLSSWADEGVLLINAFWTCGGQPRSHHWPEWTALTERVLSCCGGTTIPVVLLGGEAHKLAGSLFGNPCLCISHPSPLGFAKGRTPFRGSRPFSWINSHLSDPINWRLPHVYI